MTHRTVELAKEWAIRADPHERGRKDAWWNSAFTPASPAEAAEWKSITLPGTMQVELGVKAPPVCWYRRRLSPGDLDGLKAGRRAWLRFDSVATDVTVWVNGREAGHHLGDWVGFQFDITDALLPEASNDIVVRVDRIAPGKDVWIDGAPVQGGHITKGFHDVISLHKGGIWQPVHLDITGDLAVVPDGLGVLADSRTGRVRIDIELERNVGGGRAEIEVFSPDNVKVATERLDIKDGADSAHAQLDLAGPSLWQPDSPRLYRVELRLIGPDGVISQTESTRFGFRRVETGGLDGRQILLNGRPIFLSGVLDWGHEPRHIAPAATPEELRARFTHLREMGFNTVCLCMWYPPRYFFDIADEMGMLLWQEHPVWKPPMGDEHIPEYQRQFTKFFRRDRNHPSVVLVSGSCEHERFNPKLASWWWGRVRALMPDRIAQIQTAFFAWTDQTKTDAYDEHTYDSSGRWTHYLHDLQHDLDDLPGRPFIMGESILYTNWPDTSLLNPDPRTGSAPKPQWWWPVGLSAAAQIERWIIERCGQATLDRFKRQSTRYHLQGRKFQFEAFRAYSNHAGLVMNHLRDVPACRCGFQDEVDRWYFDPAETRSWLGEAPLLLRTDQQLRGFIGGSEAQPLEVGVSNFSGSRVEGPVKLSAEGASIQSGDSTRLAAEPGHTAWARAALALPSVRSPQRIELRASMPGLVGNSWTLWNLPAPAPAPSGVVRLAGSPFDDADRELEFEDKGYSSGWGSPVRSWKPLLPDPEVVAPFLNAWSGDARPPLGTRCILTHRLTRPVIDFLLAGGNVIHLVSRAKGSAPVRFFNTWAQLPLIIESPHGPLAPGDAEWVGDLLDHDLSRRSLRAVPVGELGLDDALEPVIRLVFCHDIVDRPRLMDYIATARVGPRGGVLVLSGADHTTPGGRYLLDRLLAYAAAPNPETRGRLDESVVRSWSVDA